MIPQLTTYQGQNGVIVCIGWSILIVIGLSLTAYTGDSPFLTFGPSSNTLIANIAIDTWTKWLVVMSYSALSTCAQCYVSATLSPYITNVIRDHKTPFPVEYERSACAIVVIKKQFEWLCSALDIFIYISAQVQFWIPAMISDILIAVYTTRIYIRSKESVEKKYKHIQENNPDCITTVTSPGWGIDREQIEHGGE